MDLDVFKLTGQGHCLIGISYRIKVPPMATIKSRNKSGVLSKQACPKYQVNQSYCPSHIRERVKKTSTWATRHDCKKRNQESSSESLKSCIKTRCGSAQRWHLNKMQKANKNQSTGAQGAPGRIVQAKLSQPTLVGGICWTLKSR